MRQKQFYNYIVYEDGTVINSQGKVRRPNIHNGRYEMGIVTESGRKHFVFSRLMYHLFVQEFDLNDVNLCVIHKDGDRFNISPDNLKLIGRKDIIQGEHHSGISKLSDKDINLIRSAYNGKSGINQHDKIGFSYNDLAKIFDVTKSEIRMIIKGETRNKKKYKLK